MRYVCYSMDKVSAMDLMESQAKVMANGLSQDATVSIPLTKTMADDLEFNNGWDNCETTLRAWVIGATAPDWNSDYDREPWAKIDLRVAEVMADDAEVRQEFAYLMPNLVLEVAYRPLSEDGLVRIKNCCSDVLVLLGQVSDDTCNQREVYQLEVASEDESGTVYTETLVGVVTPSPSCNEDVSAGAVKRPYMFEDGI